MQAAEGFNAHMINQELSVSWTGTPCWTIGYRERRARYPPLADLPHILEIRINLSHDPLRPLNRGLGRLSNRSSVVFRCRATRIPATIASTRLRPSSMLQ
jgi:hypothetical protein